MTSVEAREVVTRAIGRLSLDISLSDLVLAAEVAVSGLEAAGYTVARLEGVGYIWPDDEAGRDENPPVLRSDPYMGNETDIEVFRILPESQKEN